MWNFSKKEIYRLTCKLSIFTMFNRVFGVGFDKFIKLKRKNQIKLGNQWILAI